MKIKFSVTDVFAIIIVFIFFIAGSLVSVHRYWQYEVSFVDFGQYDQSIWKVSRFKEPIVYHFIHGKINVLGDHTTPSIFLLSPLYWFTDRSEIILIAQALVVSLSGLVLYSIGKAILKKRLLALSILLSYFLFVGLQNAVITEFHELTVMTLPLMLTMWAIINNKKILYYILLIITLGFKEITFALGIGLAIALFLLKKEWRKTAIATLLISILWGITAFAIIIPHFSKGEYLYAAAMPEGIIDKIYAIIDAPQKRHTLIFSFLSFSFLPLFAPQFWFAIFQDYASRFIPRDFVTRWDLGMHYNAQSAVLLGLSSVIGLRYLISFSFIKKHINLIAILIIINSFFLFRFILHGPLLLSINHDFYRHSAEFNYLNDMIKQVPANASVMTQNNLATRFTHQDIRLVSQNYIHDKPDYILFDVRGGQNPNNYFGTRNINKILKVLSIDSNYNMIYSKKEQFIFRRKK